MVIYDLLWCSRMFYGVLWCSMVFYGLLWSSMAFFGLLWSSIVFHGLLGFILSEHTSGVSQVIFIIIGNGHLKLLF